MNILDIKYCAQDLRFEEKAYNNFQTYEDELKEYFLEQSDGYEIFEDLKLRICEMLQSSMQVSGEAISEEDINEIKKKIGHISQLENDELIEDEDEASSGSQKEVVLYNEEGATKDKKLYRNENEKMIAGVCGGLGNYFSMDPLAFRLLFILLMIMSKGFGIFAYIILWVVLKPKALPANLSKRLFRKKSDKVLAGVCSGLASFFKTESWIVRVAFISPIILNIVADGVFSFGLSFFPGSLIGFSFIVYIVLWMTTKESETPSEELMARGEDININSISEESARVNSSQDANSGFNNLLRIFAFIVIGLASIAVFGMLIALLFSSVFLFSFTTAVLDSQLLKWLGSISVLFFLILPLVGFIVWAIRRVGGYKSPHKVLRVSFGSLWALGFVSAIILSGLLLSQMNKKSYVEDKFSVPVSGDTLYVKKMDDNFRTSSIINIKTKPLISNFYSEEGKERISRLISFKKRTSTNDSFYVKTRISAVGKGRNGAVKNANFATYRTEFRNNELYLPTFLSVSKEHPYRFQHAEVTIYVPAGKTLISDDEFDGLYYHGNKITIKNNNGNPVSITINGKKKSVEEIEKELENAMEEVGAAIEEVGEALGEDVEISIEKNDDNKSVNERQRIEEKKTKSRIKIEKQKLRIRKEQIRLEELERELEEKKQEANN